MNSYHYFVAFATPGGYGNTEVALPQPIRSLADVGIVTDLLRKAGVLDPCVMGFTPLPAPAIEPARLLAKLAAVREELSCAASGGSHTVAVMSINKARASLADLCGLLEGGPQ